MGVDVGGGAEMWEEDGRCNATYRRRRRRREAGREEAAVVVGAMR